MHQEVRHLNHFRLSVIDGEAKHREHGSVAVADAHLLPVAAARVAYRSAKRPQAVKVVRSMFVRSAISL